MKAAAFRYARPRSLDQALALLEQHGSEARVIAGGQSLMPMLALRLAAPSVLVDIGALSQLREIALEGDCIRIGALARHSQVLASAQVAQHSPLLVRALTHVAHPAIRNRGTFGGSLALADPAAELPACVLALDARMEITGKAGVREVAARDFFRGLYSTAIGESEILTAVRIPIVRSGARVFFDEVSRRSGDYAMAGLAAVAYSSGDCRLVYLGCGDRALRAVGAEAVLKSALLRHELPTKDGLIEALEKDLDPATDLQATREMRLHLAAVLAQRAARSFVDMQEGKAP